MDDYAFMVRDVFGTEYRIYADGRAEGFGPGASVFNRLPLILAAEVEKAIELHDEGADREDCHHGCL